MEEIYAMVQSNDGSYEKLVRFDSANEADRFVAVVMETTDHTAFRVHLERPVNALHKLLIEHDKELDALERALGRAS